MSRTKIESVSILFFAGDFGDVLRRHANGMPQAYGTHGEVAMLIEDLVKAGIRTSIYSFCTPARGEEEPMAGVRVISLGAKSWKEYRLLTDAIRADSSDAIIPHFGNPQMLRAVTKKACRSIAFVTGTFYRKGLRFNLRKRWTIWLLNRPKFELVSNHCRPATEQLAGLGVDRGKLIPWDVPHPLSPADSESKRTAPSPPFTVMYAGEITEVKGVGDVVRAIPHLRAATDIKFVFAGRGDVEGMRRMARRLGVEDKVEFLGIIPNTEVLERFRLADLLVVPSRWECLEGFPLTMFESIATRTPIVCSDNPVFDGVLIDRENAMVFRARDHRDAARAIDAALADAKLYLRLSSAAPDTWKRLQGPANWRELILEWVRNGPTSPWIQERMLARQSKKEDPASA